MSVAGDFLKRVWAVQPPGNRFVAVKDWETGSWGDHRVTGLRVPTLEDLYFCPNTFTGSHRRQEAANPGRWLYADLDEVEPDSLGLRPTAAWETSPGRYQALWLLSSRLKPSTLAALNQRLTYWSKADKGGWGLTKVLRVPGSYSNKHDRRFKVELLWDTGPSYAPSDLLAKVKSVETPQTRVGKLPELVLPKADAKRLYARHRQKLSLEARKLLKATETSGADRSEVLWKLERLLIECGIPANQAFVMVKGTVWNKYKGQRREDRQLWTEIQRAQKLGSGSGSSSGSSSKPEAKTRPKRSNRRLTSYDDFISRETRKPMWMVEGIWSESAHGVLAGEPKTYKSVLSTDLAVSVASGTPFLNHFPVPQIGPVVVIQKENDEAEVQDRFMRIAHSKQLLGSAAIRSGTLNYKPNTELPIHIMNNADFDLTDDLDIKWLRKQVRRHNPVLMVLDPLYLLAPGVDENSAYEMTPILEKLLRIKQTYNCGTLLVHHYKKQDKANPTHGAARISGTGVFHRWFESALLLERTDREVPLVKMVPEHRGHKPGGAVWAEFDLGEETDLHYSVKVTRHMKDGTNPEDAIPDGVSLDLSQMADRWGVSRPTAKKRIAEMGGEIVATRVNGHKKGLVRLPD